MCGLILASSASHAYASSFDVKLKSKYLAVFNNYLGRENGKICIINSPEIFKLVNGLGKNRGFKVATSKFINGETKSCGYAFITSKNRGEAKRLIDLGRKNNIVTVSDIEGFTEMGGGIEFFEEDGRVKFILNVKELRDVGANPTSDLIGIAADTI